jgi:hypothetical protein
MLAQLVRRVTFDEAPDQEAMSLVQQITLASENGTMAVPRARA